MAKRSEYKSYRVVVVENGFVVTAYESEDRTISGDTYVFSNTEALAEFIGDNL